MIHSSLKEGGIGHTISDVIRALRLEPRTIKGEGSKWFLRRISIAS